MTILAGKSQYNCCMNIHLAAILALEEVVNLTTYKLKKKQQL